MLVEDTLHLRATVTDRSGAPLSEAQLMWTSSDSTIAWVDSTGVVWTKRVGTTTIGVSAGGLRDSTTVTVREPEPVVWKQIVTETFQTCGIIESGQLYCWRFLYDWEFAEGYLLPEQRFTALSVGAVGVCGLTTGGEVYCWEARNLTDPKGEPYALPGEARFRQIAGDVYHGCGIASDGRTLCWRSDRSPSGARTWAGMFPLENDPGLVSLATVGGHVCGLTAEGVAYCWGTNRWGQLGDGTRLPRESAARVETDLRFVEIQPSPGYTCGRTADGQLYCWGYNHTYLLGIDRSPRAGCDFHRDDLEPWLYYHFCTVPQPVSTTLRFSHVRTGGAGTCALTLDGKPYCWGVNIAWNLGVPPPSGISGSCRFGVYYHCTPIPTAVLGDFNFTSLSLVNGLQHCGLTAQGAAYCWGRVSEEGLPLGYVDISRGLAPPVRLREPLRIPNTRR